MKEENKYFYPDEEDIRVGYEYETENDPIQGIWDKVVIENLYDLENFCKYNKKDNDAAIRVPYLNKEQIENEGWEYSGYKYGETFRMSGKGLEIVLYDTYNLHITARKAGPGMYEGRETLYIGKCKDINTFRYVCKLIGL